MKKTSIRAAIVLLLLVLPVSSFAFYLQVKGTYLAPSEQAFRDIYGGGLMVGAEAGLKIIGGLEAWVEGSSFRKEGKLTYTQEETTLKIFLMGAGLHYNFTQGMVSLYAGAGARFYFYNESSILGEAKKNNLGVVGKAGLFFKPVSFLLLDLKIGYSYCRLKPADFAINIGGLEAAAGLGVRF